MNEEEIHTIVFWVKASVVDQAYNKMLEATKDMEDDVKMSVVSPRLCRLDGENLQSANQKVKE